MFFMITGRQLGKTTLLANWWLEAPNFRGILTTDEKSRQHIIRHIKNMIRSLGADPKRFLEIAERNVLPVTRMVHGGIRAMGFREWAIDDLDRVLPVLLGGEQIGVVTATGTLIPSFGTSDDTVDGDVVDDTGIAKSNELEGRRAIARVPSGESLDANSGI